MDNIDLLIEKYRNELLDLSRKIAPAAEETEEEVFSLKNEESEIVSNNESVITNDLKSAHFGSLKVGVYSGNEAFPVETALVEVSDSDNNVLYRLLTNSGGIAEGMILRTPSKDENDEPGGKDGFSYYKLTVSHPDYETQRFDDVVVFEGVESIQQVFLQVKTENISREDNMNG